MPIENDLVLFDRLPLGWIDDRQQECFRIEVGDLVTILSGALCKRWRFYPLTKYIELNGKPIPVFELENLYCYLSQREYIISRDKVFDAVEEASKAHLFHLVREYWIKLRQMLTSFLLILI